MRLKDCFINNYWVTLLVREPCFYIQLYPSEIVLVGLLRFYLQNFSNTFYTFLIFTVRLSHDLLKTFLLEKFEKLIHRKFKPHFYWMLKQTRSSWYCCVGWTFKDIPRIVRLHHSALFTCDFWPKNLVKILSW